MPSPFPGMNPYFEQARYWRDFHQNFLVYLQGALNRVIAPRYRAGVEVNLYIDRTDDGRTLFGIADLGVPESPEAGESGGAAVVTAPERTTVRVAQGVRRKRVWLTIRDTDRQRIVAVVELLSPSNKAPGPDRERYIEKRTRVLQSTASLVEIDLLRGGQRMPVDRPRPCDYRVLVSRPRDRPQADLWRLRLRDPLPALPIPLRPGEPEPLIDLKAVLDRTYDEGGYAGVLYKGQPDPPLSAADAEWAKQFVPSA